MIRRFCVAAIGGCLVISICVGYAWAGRPLATEDAGILEMGAFEVQFGTDYSVRSDHHEVGLTLSPILGLFNRFEVQADFPVSFIRPDEGKDVEGFSDIGLTLKTLIFSERKWSPAVVLKSGVKFSNGNEKKGLGSGDEDFELLGVLTKTFGTLTTHANFGYTVVGHDGDGSLRNFIRYALACEYALHDRVTVVGELYGESGKHSDIDYFCAHEWSPLVGVGFQLHERAALDVGSSVTLTDEIKPAFGVTAGLTISLG